MDTGRFASILEILYSDVMNIYRLESVTAEDGTTNNVISETAAPPVNCRISYRKIDTPYETNSAGELIQFEVKIICGPSVDIKAGDYITITRKDSGADIAELKGYAGHPAQYGTHKEIILIHKGRP